MNQKRISIKHSSKFDGFLLMGLIASLPVQSYLPTFGGMSAMFFVFAGLGGYLVVFRRQALVNTLLHPVSLAGFVFVGIGIFMEIFVHQGERYSLVFRYLLMIIGGILIAALCRDRKALLFGVYGYLVLSIWMASSLFLNSYGALSSAEVSNFREAQQLRSTAVSRAKSSRANLNTIAFLAFQGVVLGLVLCLTAKGHMRRYVFLAIATFCLIGGLLSMSRSGLAIAFASCIAVAYGYGIMKPRIAISGLILVLGIFMLVPVSVFSRMTFTTEKASGHYRDGRIELYVAAVHHFPEYVLAGVGVSGFYGKWGRNSKFWDSRDVEVESAHNVFLQIIIFWGLPGLLGFLAFVWKAYRSLPLPVGSDPLRLCILGIVVSAFLQLLVAHNLYNKEYSLALGLVIGGSQWIWQGRNSRVGFKGRRLIQARKISVVRCAD